jgi:ABC-type branched-subunit amino acid transport system substrate-binding protein
MPRKLSVKMLVALTAVGLVSVMFVTTGAIASTASKAPAAASPFPKTGACDKSKTPVELGITTVLESPVLSLIDQVDAAKASVVAFNKNYKGVGGHCINLTVCDDKADPNTAAACARKFVDSKIVATINDTSSFGSKDVATIFADAKLARVDISPNTDDLQSPVAYSIGGGGVGTTFMMAPPLLQTGHKKLYMIGVDSPTIELLPKVMDGMIKSYGAEFVGLSKVAGGTTDFQQYILAAEDAGADGVMLPLGENEAVQVLRAAQQLGSKLDFSASLGTFGTADVASFGKFAKQIHFNAELPPITGDPARWPILPTVIKDLSASGKKELQKDQIKSSPFRSWVAVYHFKTIMENFGDPDNITRESVVTAMNAAKDVDTFGLIPAWSPNTTTPVLSFNRISNPWYYSVSWDGKKFVVGKKLLSLTDELAGTHDYAQPAAA